MSAYEFTTFYQRVSKKTNKLGARLLGRSVDDGQGLDDPNTGELAHDDDGESSEGEDRELGTETGTMMGRPTHTRIAFKSNQKLSTTHHVYGIAKMRVPYQVDARYPKLPSHTDKVSVERLETYVQYMLGIFRPWSTTMNVTCDVNETWWSIFKQFMESCPPWVTAIIDNMKLALERDDTMTKAHNHMDRISSNTMNHVDKKFEYADDEELDWRRYPEEAAQLLQDLESDMILTGLNFSRPQHEKEQVFVNNALERLSCRFNSQQQSTANNPSPWIDNSSLSCILEQEFSQGDIATQLKSWRAALKELVRCNDYGLPYDMYSLRETERSAQ
ncbi:unnamed protein product [Calypogeia fissa]